VDLTQEKLAHDAHIERAHMSKIETGRRNVTILNLLRIADALGCDASEILASAAL
jgi:transcriptional regulator with XRE-family HTH domain